MTGTRTSGPSNLAAVGYDQGVIDRLSFHWYVLKTFLEHSLAFSDDVLHTLAGVLLQLLFAAMLRSTIAKCWPWTIVFVLELANEASDLRFERWPDLAMQLGEGAKDVILTMALPTLLLIVARRFPKLLRGSRSA